MTGYLPLALRAMRRRAGVYLSAAAILALGIGMSVAMFSLVDAVLIRPLPFPGQHSLIMIWKANPPSGAQVEELAYPELLDLQQNIQDFESVAVLPTSLYGYARVLERGTAEPVQMEGAPVSHDFFHVLGIAPAIGRDFSSADERIGAAPVVILSNRVWHEQLGADPNVIGHTVRLSGEAFTVIGVMAPGVEFPRGAGFWIPLGVEQHIVERRGATFLQAIARVKPGHSLQAVSTEVDALFQRLAKDHTEVYAPTQRAVVTPLVEYWTGSARLHLWIMLAAALLLLGASAVSAGSLLLARTMARRREISTRVALGASRGQIFAELATEAVVVAAGAVTAGLAIAKGAILLLTRWAPVDIPRLPDAALTPRVFGFASLAAVVAAAACSFMAAWPILHAPRGRRSAGRRGFLAAQAAATVMLLAMAALLTLSYRAMLSADTGFAHRDAVTMNLALRGPGVLAGQAFSKPQRDAFYTRLLDELRAAPGVESAAAVLVRPLEGTIGWDTTYQFAFEDGSQDTRSLPKANYEAVTPGYFAALGTPLVEGRDFDDHDSADGERVAIISRALAEKIRAAGYPPVGSRVRLGISGWAKVIGVSADARYRSVTQAGADVFVPAAQASQPTNYVVIRGALPEAELAALVRRTLARFDSSQAVSGVQTIGELIDANAARHRFNMSLLLWFGLCAAILAAAGVRGAVAEAMAARRSELAIKAALGAQRRRLMRDAVSGVLGSVSAGILAGLFGVTVLGSLASNVLYQVSARDPGVLACAGAFLLAISAAAAFRPAWRATGENPREGLAGTSRV